MRSMRKSLWNIQVEILILPMDLEVKGFREEIMMSDEYFS